MRLMKYLILRFMPRPETGEFINIGVLLLCDALDWLDYKADIRQIRTKVNRAYPGIYRSVQEDLHLMMQSLDYQKHQHNHLQTLSLSIPTSRKDCSFSVTCPRSSPQKNQPPYWKVCMRRSSASSPRPMRSMTS